MAKVGQPYTSGNWIVNEGSEDEFIARWTEFTEWALANAPGADHFVLIRETADPRRFVSFGAWEDAASPARWGGTGSRTCTPRWAGTTSTRQGCQSSWAGREWGRTARSCSTAATTTGSPPTPTGSSPIWGSERSSCSTEGGRSGSWR